MSGVKAVNAQNFIPEVLDQKLPVMVDFWSQQCGPCQQLGPVLDSIVPKYQDRMKIVKLNIDENPEVADKYQIMSIPCMIIFWEKMEMGRMLGFMEEARLTAEIDKVIG